MRFSQVLKEFAQAKRAEGLKESITQKELHDLRRRFESGEFDEKKPSLRERRKVVSGRKTLQERRKELIERRKALQEKRKALESKKSLQERREEIKKRIQERRNALKNKKLMQERRQEILEKRKALKEREARIARIRQRIKECKCKDGECKGDCEKNHPMTRHGFTKRGAGTAKTEMGRPSTTRKPFNREDFKERLEKIHARRRMEEAKKKLLAERRARFAERKNRRMKEDDMGMGQVDAVSGEGMDTNATDPNATANAPITLDPATVTATIEQIKTEIDNLATQLGVQAEPVDTNADANIPPEGDVNMETLPSAEGTDQAQPVMTESQKRVVLRSFRKIKEAFKNEKIARVFESKYPLAYSSIVKLIDGPIMPSESVIACDTVINQVDKTPYNVDKNNDESLLNKVVSLNQLIKGTDKNVVRWGQDPKSKIDYKFKESDTEKMITDRIKENQDRWDFGKILKSGVLN